MGEEARPSRYEGCASQSEEDSILAEEVHRRTQLEVALRSRVEELRRRLGEEHRIRAEGTERRSQAEPEERRSLVEVVRRRLLLGRERVGSRGVEGTEGEKANLVERVLDRNLLHRTVQVEEHRIGQGEALRTALEGEGLRTDLFAVARK
jgi:hypothetical protein